MQPKAWPPLQAPLPRRTRPEFARVPPARPPAPRRELSRIEPQLPFRRTVQLVPRGDQGASRIEPDQRRHIAAQAGRRATVHRDAQFQRPPAVTAVTAVAAAVAVAVAVAAKKVDA